MQLDRSRVKAAIELLSVIGPIICLIDCTIIPLLLLVLPVVGIHQVFHGIGDQLLLLLVVAICAPTVTLGFLRHRQKRVFLLMALGFTLMFVANFAGHSIDESIHFALTSLGSLFLIKANFDNRQLSKHCCSCSADHDS